MDHLREGDPRRVPLRPPDEQRGTYSESTYYRLDIDRRTGETAYSRVVCWCDSLAEDNDGRTEGIDEAEVPDEAITDFMEALKRAGVQWE